MTGQFQVSMGGLTYQAKPFIDPEPRVLPNSWTLYGEPRDLRQLVAALRKMNAESLPAVTLRMTLSGEDRTVELRLLDWKLRQYEHELELIGHEVQDPSG